MLVSLKILPITLTPERMNWQFSVGNAVGVWTGNYDGLFEAMTSERPINVPLLAPSVLPPLPSAKRVKRATMKQEEAVAADMGGHRQRGSGALSWRKGDGRVKGKYRIENKTAFTKGIRVERADLDKIRSECALGEVPLFQINFTNRSTLHVDDQWILVPYEHWKQVSGAPSRNDQ